jgi:glycosyltransferase involved in cell wall biosynthesis
MVSNSITHIVPNVFFESDGVAQYANLISKGIESATIRFITPTSYTENHIDRENSGFIVLEPIRHKWIRKLSEFDGPIILHYSGYGYAKKGAPLWLLDVLLDLKRNKPNQQLITVFHELEANGTFFSKAFWIYHLQRFICRTLADISSDILVTHSKNYQALLSHLNYKNYKLKHLPMCSTIGERSIADISHNNRQSSAIVFGTLGRRKAAYKVHSQLIEQWLDVNQINKIIDIGKGNDGIPDNYCGRPVERCGILDNNQIQNHLLNASIGLIEYPPELLGKSSIFAAYSAHGLPTLTMRSDAKQKYLDQLKLNKNIFSIDNKPINVQTKEIQEDILAWYSEHNAQSHCDFFSAKLIQPSLCYERKGVALITSQRTQNTAPERYLVGHEKYNFLQVVLSQEDQVDLWKGDEYINKSMVKDSVPSGLATLFLNNLSPWPRLDKFYGLMNIGIRKLVSNSDVVVVYGHAFISFWLSILWAKIYRKKIILSNDAIDLGPSHFKALIKRVVFPFLYNNIVDHVVVTSNLAKDYLLSIGVKEKKISITPYTVDNDLIRERSLLTDRKEIRSKLGAHDNTKIVLFCGKLIPRKNPIELIHSFSQLKTKDALLVIIGDGPQREEISSVVKSSGIDDKVRLLGLVPYEDLPSIYHASDVLVHPAKVEPFGLVVNEAMLSGTCVITSDRVGSSKDLIIQGSTGFTYPIGDKEKLAELIDLVMNSDALRERLVKTAQNKMNDWSPQNNANALCNAITKTLMSSNSHTTEAE